MLKVLMISGLLFLCVAPASGNVLAKEVEAESTDKELNDPEMDCTKKMNLTLEQQKQLEQIYLRIFKDYSDLIHVYSQAGALTPWQTKIRHIMLNNYIKTFYKRNYRWCSEHESDEWEEEWYNNDPD
ncbi:DUF2680 domain-containing protein [Pseudoneobacillus sp. C159]